MNDQLYNIFMIKSPRKETVIEKNEEPVLLLH